ncbi:hypothetical protein CYMTET_26852, partial [Cymbomonas tetramitiformis]
EELGFGIVTASKGAFLRTACLCCADWYRLGDESMMFRRNLNINSHPMTFNLRLCALCIMVFMVIVYRVLCYPTLHASVSVKSEQAQEQGDITNPNGYGTPMVTSEVGDNKLCAQELLKLQDRRASLAKEIDRLEQLKEKLQSDVGSGDEVKSGRTQGTCGNNMAFTLSPSHTAVDSTNYSEYTELQLQRSKGREYPQQEMVQEDLAHLHDLLEHYAKSIKNLKKMPLLELGARTGWGTAYMRSKGWVSAQGLELSKQAAEFAQSKGRPVTVGDMHELSHRSCSQGVVFSRHSLEHTRDFNQVLHEVYRVTAAQGFAYFVVPVEPSTQHQLHTQPFRNDAQLIEGMIKTGFHILASEMMLTRMGPVLPREISEELTLGYEQRVLAFKNSC